MFHILNITLRTPLRITNLVASLHLHCRGKEGQRKIAERKVQTCNAVIGAW
jgi:hypothetical protein